MKPKFLITALLVSSVIIGGCSASSSKSDDTMDHSKMTKEEMSNMEGMDHSNMSGNDMATMNGHESHTNPLALNNSTGENELALPPLLEAKDGIFSITAQQGTSEIFKGINTETYGYNSSYLGPVIKVNEGQKVTFKTNNQLSEPTTFHWHGLDLPGEADGGPHHLLQPGDTKNVTFTVKQGASTLWFHPHPVGATAEQVYKGLAGLIYVEDEHSKKLGLPSEYGVNDFPLVFQDRKFDDTKQLNFKAAMNEDGTIGDTLLINGTVNPKLTVGKEKVRLRLLNGSNARNYTFKLNTGDSFQQIATDGGFVNKPISMNELSLTPGERAEIIIDFSTYNVSTDIALMNEEDTKLLSFNIVDKKSETSSDSLKNLNNYVITDEELKLPVSKKLELFGMGKMVTINNKQFDMNRIDFTQKQGETEIWEIYNKPDMMGGMTHPFHIHGTQFKILSIDGKEPPTNEYGWKDTVAIDAGETVRLAVKFNNKGIYMFHCHILEHEENGMMGQVKVE